MLVGGTGSRIHPVRAIHARLIDPLGYDEANPAASCKPFDERRNGQVAAEGAACLVLEEESHALARGAKIYGYMLSGGSSCVSHADGDADVTQAVLNASRAALRRAGVQVSELSHINAHGLGSPDGDRQEASALRQLLEEAPVSVTSMKGYFGNAGAAGGFLELIGSLLSVNAGQVPTTLNTDHPDPELGLKIATGEPAASQGKIFLNVNYTRAGQASAAVVSGV
jgi:3-oxoacyl-[acyl-carrier-protein] synthase II